MLQELPVVSSLESLLQRNYYATSHHRWERRMIGNDRLICVVRYYSLTTLPHTGLYSESLESSNK